MSENKNWLVKVRDGQVVEYNLDVIRLHFRRIKNKKMGEVYIKSLGFEDISEFDYDIEEDLIGNIVAVGFDLDMEWGLGKYYKREELDYFMEEGKIEKIDNESDNCLTFGAGNRLFDYKIGSTFYSCTVDPGVVYIDTDEEDE